MNDMGMLFMAAVVGAALGGFFFGGLWWTVQKVATSPRPALWVFGSLLVRLGIVLCGFYFVGRGNGTRLIVCLAGFIFARFLVMRLTRHQQEAPHAT
ncbi:MAG: ATP synthase subunit I [Kiritimatiellae bacterium]|nr:ATP synthase subunit I [Kiritimatiellia bacterium]